MWTLVLKLLSRVCTSTKTERRGQRRQVPPRQRPKRDEHPVGAEGRSQMAQHGRHPDELSGQQRDDGEQRRAHRDNAPTDRALGALQTERMLGVGRMSAAGVFGAGW